MRPTPLLILLQIIIIINVSLGALFLGATFKEKQTLKAQKQEKVKISSSQTKPLPSPVLEELLRHPMLSDWTGGVEGTVIAKNVSSFTIGFLVKETQGNLPPRITGTDPSRNMKISFLEGTTLFKKDPHTTDVDDAKEVAFSDLKEGNIVRGTVKLKEKGTSWDIIGGYFFID